MKDGSVKMICSIDDVIKWSQWLNPREVKAQALARTKEFKFTEDKFLACSSSFGSCE